MSNTHEHLEHAEHAQHHSHHPFDKRVAMTIAIVAACLALITMLGHRAHNEVLSLQTLYGTLKVQESNAWAQYQAKRMRQHLDENSLTLLKVLASGSNNESIRVAAEKSLSENVNRYKSELAEIKTNAEQLQKKAADTQQESEHVHHQADRMDIAHLAAELGLILCSIAVLVKRKSFWFTGIGVTFVSLVILISALMMNPHHHSDSSESNSHPTSEQKEKH
jgi:hypothetical protein